MARNEVKIVVTAQDRASSTLKGVTKNAAMMGAALVTVGAAAGVALAGIGVASLKMAVDFDKGMREVNTLLGLSEAGFQKLGDETLALAKQIGFTANEVVPALYQAISAGVPQSNVMTFLATASKSAVGGVTDLRTAVDILTTSLNNFEAQGLTVEAAADALFTTVKLGKTNFEQLSAALPTVLPIAAAAGVSFDEVSAAMAVLTAKTGQTAESTTRLRSALEAIAAPTVRTKEKLAELGLADLAVTLRTEGLQAALDRLREATGGNLETLRKLVGSSEAVQAVLLLTGDNADAFSSALDAMEGKTGAAARAADEMERSASRLWQRLKANLNVAMIEIGQELLPVFIEQLGKFSTWWDANGERTTDQLAQGMRGVADAVGLALEGWTKYVDALDRFRNSRFGEFIGLAQDAPPDPLDAFTETSRGRSLSNLIGDQDALAQAARSMVEQIRKGIEDGLDAEHIQILRTNLSAFNDKLVILDDIIAGRISPDVETAIDKLANLPPALLDLGNQGAAAILGAEALLAAERQRLVDQTASNLREQWGRLNDKLDEGRRAAEAAAEAEDKLTESRRQQILGLAALLGGGGGGGGGGGANQRGFMHTYPDGTTAWVSIDGSASPSGGPSISFEDFNKTGGVLGGTSQGAPPFVIQVLIGDTAVEDVVVNAVTAARRRGEDV